MVNITQQLGHGGNATMETMAETEEADLASLSIMVQIVMLILTFIIGHLLRRRNVLIISEAGSALLLGVLVGLVVKMVGHAGGFRQWINFNNEFFFYFLLPPIIFESGWSLRPARFFANFGAICMFAVVGTVVSAFVVGYLVYCLGKLSSSVVQLPFLECLLYGSLISATDPVTVLAIFNELGADPNLYALVFGESVINDAVAIVLYRSVQSFLDTPVSKQGIMQAIWIFMVIFIGSFSIGVIVSLLSALLFKYGGFQKSNLGVLESCIVALFPYMAYMMSDASKLSGIVAILFTGITMKHYTYPNLSKEAQHITTTFFAMLAKLAETFVFIYMGVTVFLESQSWSSYQFAFGSLVIILIARVVNVYPCAYAINWYRGKGHRIPWNHQHALWFSGLRGAMAFALALQSVSDLESGHGRVLLTSTLITVLFTVLLIGGSTPHVLNLLKIECGIHNGGHGEESEMPDVGGSRPDPGSSRPSISFDNNIRRISSTEVAMDDEMGILDKKLIDRHKAKMRKKIKKLKADARKLKRDASFSNLDKKYFKPFFVTSAPISGPRAGGGAHSDSELPSNQDSPSGLKLEP